MNPHNHIPLWDLNVGILVNLKFLNLLGKQYDKIKLIRIIHAGESISKHDLDIYYMPWDERYAWKYKELQNRGGIDESTMIDRSTSYANSVEFSMTRHKNTRYVFQIAKRHYLIVPDHEKSKILINLPTI